MGLKCQEFLELINLTLYLRCFTLYYCNTDVNNNNNSLEAALAKMATCHSTYLHMVPDSAEYGPRISSTSKEPYLLGLW